MSPQAAAQTVNHERVCRDAAIGLSSDLVPARAACERVLAGINRQSDPRAWAGAQHSLGVVLTQLDGPNQGPANGAERLSILQAARTAFERSLEVYSPSEDALLWAGAQSKLGWVHWRLGQRQTGAASIASLQRAQASYQLALPVFARLRDPGKPDEWALTQMSLAKIDIDIGDRGGDAGAYQSAITRYRAVLGIYSTGRIYERATRELGDAQTKLNAGQAGRR